MLGTLHAVAVLGGATTVAWANPTVLGTVQMDAVTAGGADAYAIAQANATGQNAFTETYSNAVALNGLFPQTSNWGGSRAGAMAAATSPSAYIDASAQTAYGTDEAIALAVAGGPSAFVAISAGVVSIDGRAYLTGSLAGSAFPGMAIATAPVALSATSGMVWSAPAVRSVARTPAVSVASTGMPGGELVTYTLATGDQDDGPGDSTALSLSFLKSPGSRIPPVFAIDISGVIPVISTSLLAKPAAM